MVSGRNKIIAFKIISSLIGCLVVILVHEIGYEWHMDHFQPHSRGVTLGFVMFYMQFIVNPGIFVSSFLRIRYSLAIMILVFLLMFCTWYETNPLRVLLMFLSGVAGYSFIILCVIFKNKKLPHWLLKEK